MRNAFYKLVSFVRKVTITTLVASLCISASYAAPKGTIADKYAAIVIDANSGNTLFQFNANARRYPASLTKMMTLYLLFEAMKEGRISPNTPIRVSAYAVSRPPTKMGFKPGQTIGAEDAAKALITRSANDVAAAIAEYLGGSEAKFAQRMTTKAWQLGMMNTNFTNASGLPNVNNYSTARDMAILSIALREHFPRQYRLFKTTSFSFHGRKINGHNKLVKTMKGVDGIKTGYVQMSGYNLATSFRRDGKSLVGVVMGGRTAAERDAHMSSLLQRYISQASTKKKGAILVAAAPHTILPRGGKAPVPTRKVDHLSNNHNGVVVTALMQPRPIQPRAISIDAVIAANNAVRVPTAANQIDDVDPVITASAPSRTTPAGLWAIQIGSLPSEEQAKTLLNKVAESNLDHSILANATAVTEIFEKNDTYFYRARFTGFHDKNAAQSACSALKKANFNCYAISQ